MDKALPPMIFGLGDSVALRKLSDLILVSQNRLSFLVSHYLVVR